MSHSDYLIENCSTKDSASACPKHWEKLKPAFSDMVRHCNHCNKKVYLCETDEQIKFYTSVKFCIAVAQPRGLLNVEGNTPSNVALVPNIVESSALHGDGSMGSISRSVPNVWRRSSSLSQGGDGQDDQRASFPQMQRVTDDSDIPAFLRKRSK